MAHEQKTQKKIFWLDTSLLPWWKQVMYPQNDVHTSEDILTKMINKFPLTLNQFTSGILYFFCQWNDVRTTKQINASFIDILRIKWLVFFIAVVFLSHNSVPLQAPKHRPIISPRPVEQTAFRKRHQRQWI